MQHSRHKCPCRISKTMHHSLTAVSCTDCSRSFSMLGEYRVSAYPMCASRLKQGPHSCLLWVLPSAPIVCQWHMWAAQEYVVQLRDGNGKWQRPCSCVWRMLAFTLQSGSLQSRSTCNHAVRSWNEPCSCFSLTLMFRLFLCRWSASGCP